MQLRLLSRYAKAGITGTAAQVDLSNIINSDYVSEKVEYNKKSKYDFKLENTLDEKVLMKEFEKNLGSGEKKSTTGTLQMHFTTLTSSTDLKWSIRKTGKLLRIKMKHFGLNTGK